MVGNEKTPDIAQHHHDVLIDGVDMKQVMLHLTHNVSEHPQISTQYRGLIHQPEDMCDALALLQNFQKCFAIDGITSELGIHHVANVVERAKRFGGQTFNAMGLLKKQKGFKDGVWVRLIEVITNDF